MDHTRFALLLTAEQVSELVGFKRSKIYEMMKDKDNPFPAQACRGRWRRTDIVRWVAQLGRKDEPRAPAEKRRSRTDSTLDGAARGTHQGRVAAEREGQHL